MPYKKSNAPGKLLKSHFGSMEISEAKKELTLFPVWSDFENAVRNDPHLCGFARCAARAIGATNALFFKRYVYIDHFGPDGKKRVYRYTAGKAVFRTLEAFDKGRVKKGDVLREFRLMPPSPSDTLKGKRKTTLRWRRSDSGKAILAEQEARNALRVVTNQRDRLKDLLEEARQTAPQAARTKELRQRLDNAVKAVEKARVKVDQKAARAKDARRESYATAPAKPRNYNVGVRSGTGYFTATQ